MSSEPNSAPIFTTDAYWRKDVADKYKNAIHELSSEQKLCTDPTLKASLGSKIEALRDPDTQEAVNRFGGRLLSNNAVFVPVVQDILSRPPEGIPAVLRTAMAESLAFREAKIPPSLERDPEMQRSLTAVLRQGGDALMSGSPSSSTAAVAAGDRYMRAFEARSTEAGSHIKMAATELARSPEGAVDWCRKFVGYTQQEIVPHGLDQLNVTVSDVKDRLAASPEPWSGQTFSLVKAGTEPSLTTQAAWKVLESTVEYIGNGVPRVSKGVEPVKLALQTYEVIAERATGQAATQRASQRTQPAPGGKP